MSEILQNIDAVLGITMSLLQLKGKWLNRAWQDARVLVSAGSSGSWF
jgi:hypothetical protein